MKKVTIKKEWKALHPVEKIVLVIVVLFPIVVFATICYAAWIGMNAHFIKK